MKYIYYKNNTTGEIGDHGYLQPVPKDGYTIHKGYPPEGMDKESERQQLFGTGLTKFLVSIYEGRSVEEYLNFFLIYNDTRTYVENSEQCNPFTPDGVDYVKQLFGKVANEYGAPSVYRDFVLMLDYFVDSKKMNKAALLNRIFT